MSIGRPGADHGFPPTRLSGYRVVVDHVLIAGERVADENGIAALGVECAVGLVGDLQRGKIDAGIQAQRIVRAKAYDQRMRLIRFARTVGKIDDGRSVGHITSGSDASGWLVARNGGRNGVNRPVGS